MIKLKYYPIRFGKECTEFDIDFSRDTTIQDYIEQAKIECRACDVIVEGKAYTDLNRSIDNHSEIVVTPKIGAPLAAWWAAATFWQGVALVAAALSTAYSIYQAITAPRAGAFGSIGSGMDESSPTYGWDGIRTIQEVGVPVKVIGGRHRTGGNIINQFISADGDKQYLNILIGACEGPVISIDEVLVNGNPIENYSDIEVVTRLGTNDQTVIPGFEDLHNLYTVNVQLLKDSAHVYTTIDSDVEGFEIYLTCPNGIFQIDNGGGVKSWDVSYRVEYKVHTDPDYTDLGVTTISGKSRSTIRRVYRKDGLTPEQYDIRITRTSNDSSFPPQIEGDLYLSSLDEIKTDNLSYPNTALIGIKALATDQLSGATPNFTFIVEDGRLTFPDVLDGEGGDPVDWEDYYYDPDDEVFRLFEDDSALYWDGESYTTGFCANPIWFNKDLLLNTRYGTGEFTGLADVDSDELLEEALYCEEKIADGAGGFEKRFRMDVVVDSPVKAPDLVAQLTAVFQAFPFYSQNGFSFRIDRPCAKSGDLLLAKQTFGMGNIGRNSFQQSWKSKTEVYNVIEVQFSDQDSNYENEIIAVEDEAALIAGEPRRVKKIRVFTTKKSYAIRAGRYALWIGKYINRSATQRVFMDAVACQAGDVVNVSHDIPQWGFSGRVKEDSTTTLVKLDRSVVVEPAKTYHLLVRFADNTIEEKVVSSIAGTYTELEVSEAFTQAPADFDVYSFGEVDKVAKPFRVIGIKRENNGDCNLSLIEYVEDIYDDTAVVIPTNNYSSLTAEIPAVENLVLTERVVVVGDGSIQTAIDVWFSKPDVTSHRLKSYEKAKIYLSDNAGLSWEYKGETYDEHFWIFEDLIIGVEYLIVVTSVAGTGEEKLKADCPQDTITLTGKTTPPADVTNFSSVFLNDLLFTWDKPTDPDIAGFEIRDEDANWGVQSSAMIYRGLTNSFYYGVPASRSPGTFYIKSFDRSGNYSENSVNTTPSNTAPATPSITSTQWFGFAKIEWSDSADADLVRYEVYKSGTNAWAGEELLEMKTPGRAALVQGNAPVDAIADSADAGGIIDAELIGKGVNYFVGDVILQTSGTYKDQEAVITAFNNATGEIEVASWPSGTPDADDEFVIKDRAYYKVRAVDTYGPGSFSTAVTINFTPLSEAEIGDAIISARKLIAGEVITLSAQIKDALITSAKILELDGGKITAETINATSLISVPFGKIEGGTIEAAILILGSGGVFMSSNYVKGTSGFKLDATEGLEMNDGMVNADIVLIEGARLRDQFEVTPASTLENQDSGQWDQGTKTDVVASGDKLKLTDVNVAGSFTSQILDCGAGPEYGTIQWDETYNAITNDVAPAGTPTAYLSGGGAGNNPANANDQDDDTYADWGDGTGWWGQRACLQIDLGSAKTITSIRAKWLSHQSISSKGWNLQYSDDGGVGGTWVDATVQYYSAELIVSVDAGSHRYWRLRGGISSPSYDSWRLYTFELRITNSSNPDITVQVRTDDNAGFASPTDWSEELTNPAGSNISVTAQRYIQYKINFSTNATTKDYIEVDNIKINYDIVKISGYGKVLASSGDSGVGYLDAKVDDVTIEVNGSNKLAVKGYSSAVYCWTGQIDRAASGRGSYLGTSLVAAINSSPTYHYLVTNQDSNDILLRSKFKKMPWINTLTIYCSIWNGSSSTGYCTCRVDVGATNGTVNGTAGRTTPEWKTFTIDVSGLTNGTVYDLTVGILSSEYIFFAAYLGAIIIFGS